MYVTYLMDDRHIVLLCTVSTKQLIIFDDIVLGHTHTILRFYTILRIIFDYIVLGHTRTILRVHLTRKIGSD